MNKKIISIFAAAAISASGAAMLTAAADNTVTVVVNGAKVVFADQQPVIENDRTLIPVRGAFEAMGATVDWDGDARKVTIRDESGTKYAFLTIDSDVMETQTYKSLFDVDKAEVKLDVPAQIKNDRTLIPLRAVGEALGADVSWDGDTYTASITSKKVSEEKKSQLLGLSLAQGESLNDDEAVVLLNISNMSAYPDTYVSSVTATLNYDPSVLELISSTPCNAEADIPLSSSVIGGDNPKFEDGKLKALYIIADEENAAKADGSILKLTFKKLSNEASKVSISTDYASDRDYDTSIILTKLGDTAETAYDGINLNIDTTELEVK